MNNKFDELAKGLAQSVTRRQALTRFGVGLAGMVLGSFGLQNEAKAAGPPIKLRGQCQLDSSGNYTGGCLNGCDLFEDLSHCVGTTQQPGTRNSCGYLVGPRMCEMVAHF
jgi:hypothetical protein